MKQKPESLMAMSEVTSYWVRAQTDTDVHRVVLGRF